MLKFNHGRFELERLSFSIPDNLYLTAVGEMQIENGFELFTEDDKIHMVVAGNDVAENARESIESIFDEEDNFRKLSEIVEIERAGLDGYSVTYEDSKAYHWEACLNTPDFPNAQPSQYGEEQRKRKARKGSFEWWHCVRGS